MSLNLSDRIAVVESPAMQTRCTGAVAKYALYLLGNAQATTPQLAWAREAIRTPAEVGSRVSYHVLDNTDFLTSGSDITDVQLQGAVEAAVNARFIAA